jgi:hypothetical protein
MTVRRVEPADCSGRPQRATRHRMGHAVRPVRSHADEPSAAAGVTAPHPVRTSYTRALNRDHAGATMLALATATASSRMAAEVLTRYTNAAELERDHDSDATVAAAQLRVSVTDRPATRAANSPYKTTDSVRPCDHATVGHPANDRTPCDLGISPTPLILRPTPVCWRPPYSRFFPPPSKNSHERTRP